MEPRQLCWTTADPPPMRLCVKPSRRPSRCVSLPTDHDGTLRTGNQPTGTSRQHAAAQTRKTGANGIREQAAAAFYTHHWKRTINILHRLEWSCALELMCSQVVRCGSQG
ncbi:hypothetical protein N658DRAFT_498978 [Parathielavia hyrcaniae]|uniref:Uncharacterized protein n=1 Tax=Parathielavia hyrcaniae TaxID=113614 RepID=A0AAN6PXJ7_9PEZI|nr:hypothetical protein N658DRAFT_498978 [Parathielavia hyrcaniae]